MTKDLCARLPYGIKCKYYDCCEGDYDEGIICGFERQEYMQINGVCIHIEEVKPYLYPLSSMTEEQKKEEYEICKYYLNGYESKLIDFYNKNHLDYRGLIEKGLAIDCTNLNVY